MKLLTLKTRSALAVVLGCMLGNGLAYAGHGSSGGGDAAEVEFEGIGQGIVSAMKEKDRNLGFDVDALKRAVEATQVNMLRHRIVRENVERDAVNFPTETRIDVNRNQWMTLDPSSKVRLAFHEYLGIAGIETNVYSVSSRITTVLNNTEIARIVTGAAPVLSYHCEIQKMELNDPRDYDGRNYRTCATTDLTTNAIDSNGNFLSGECDSMQLGLSRLKGLYGLEVEFRKWEKGTTLQNWTDLSHRETAVSAFSLDYYNSPANFTVYLEFPVATLLHPQKKVNYRAKCIRN